MRLLVVSSWFPYPPTNGSKLRAWHLLRQLSRRHEIVLVSFAEAGEAQPADVSALRAHCREVVVVAGNPHRPARRLRWRGYFGHVPRSYAQTFSPRAASEVARIARDCDAAIGFQIGAALYFDRPLHLPSVFEEAEVSTIRANAAAARRLAARIRRELTWRKHAAFVRRLVASCSRTTVVSEIERRSLAAAGCDIRRVAIVPNGVDADYLLVDEPKDTDSLIYPGSLTYSANLDAVEHFVSDIYPHVRRARPAVTLAVTGKCDGVRLDRIPLDGVRLTGLVPDVRPYVARSKVCVVPLRQGGGTRLKILEAMALGTPVVSTTKGAEGLDVRDGEHLLIADQPELFARRIVELLHDDARAQTLARNARRLVAEKYTWDRTGLLLEQVLQDALEAFRVNDDAPGRPPPQRAGALGVPGTGRRQRIF